MKKIYVMIGLLMFMSVMSGCGGGSNDNTGTETVPTEETASTEETTTAEGTTTTEETTPSIVGEWKGLCLANAQAGTSLTRTLFVMDDEDIIEVTKRYSTSTRCDGANSTETKNRVYVIGENIENTLYRFELTGTTAYRIDISSATLKIYFPETPEADTYKKQL